MALKLKNTFNDTSPEGKELLVVSPNGVKHLASWRPAYRIFTCQSKGESSSDWWWAEIEVEYE